MSKLYDVIIAGAGPVGLLLSCELSLAGASVLILERDLEPTSPWKSLPLGRRGLNTLSVEALYRRELLDKLTDVEKRPFTIQKTSGFQFGGHFAGLNLDANKFDLTRWKYRLPGPALLPQPTSLADVEKALTERAEELGVTIRRGCGFAKIADQNSETVTVEAGELEHFRGRWLVGCDGGRSAVRKDAGFAFVGTEARVTGFILKCEFDQPDMVKTGFHVTKYGMYIVAPQSLYLVDFDNAAFDRTQEITREHVQDLFHRISGLTDVNIATMDVVSSFTDRAKQATAYRKGRILLAGDAAHIHGPLGAQGLNVGLVDAMNLGWKLAATVRQEANSEAPLEDLTLLDTYDSERHPVGAWVLDWTRAQAMSLQPDAHGAATQALIRDMIDTVDGTNLFIDRIWGLSQRYSLGEGEANEHPLVGCSAPDFEFDDGSRLGRKLKNGRGLVIDFEDDVDFKELLGLDEYAGKVDYIGMGAKNRCCLRALLLRPDGIVAWAAEDDRQLDIEAAKVGLKQWFAL